MRIPSPSGGGISCCRDTLRPVRRARGDHGFSRRSRSRAVRRAVSASSGVFVAAPAIGTDLHACGARICNS